jgi:hypothetical protein
MARSILKRGAAATLSALLLLGVVVTVAMAVDASWNATCNAGEICNWKHTGYAVPLAATSSSDNNYTEGNDVYPNSQDGINDSVSSVRNMKSSNDAIWYTSAGYSGTPYCVPQGGYQSDQLGFLNDSFSSHLIASSDAC